MTRPDDRPASGLYPIQYALFDAAGSLSRDAMRRQIEACVGMNPAGIATLGLATEVRALSSRERLQVVEWNIEDIAGRSDLAVTIFEPTAAEQSAAISHAAKAGASLVIVQPPAEATDADTLLAAFSRIIDAAPLPVAIQNAPQYIGVGLSVPQIDELARRHANLVAVKQEVPAAEIAELTARLGDRLAVFSGRGGLELIDCLRAGIHGHVPAPEYADQLAEIWAKAGSGDADGAYAAYARILPLATFVMQSLDTLLTYGKLLLCCRLGLEFHQRNPNLRPTRFGCEALADHSRRAGIEADFRAAFARFDDLR